MKKKFVNFFGPMRRVALVATAVTMSASMAFAQVQTKVSGKVVDNNGEPLPGVAVMIQGATGGTITDFDGNYSLSVPAGATLSFSFIGFESQAVTVAEGKNTYNITMEDDSKELDEVIIVGYGQQKKASVVGAITQTTGEVLERAAGISDVGAALTGNLPGVVTTQSTGMPGQEEPKIVIRGSSSPNSSDPLVLVDGIERPMSTVDMASVANISVLKDASATAVYGVKGANGVILITTKRGSEGKAQVNVSANVIMKMVSKLPGKLDSYDALMKRNMAIEHELNINESAWKMVNSQEFINHYRGQQTQEEKERYVNIDWQDELFKKRAMSYNANVNVLGGSKFVKYFASADYVHEGDMFKDFDSERGYQAGFGFDKVSFRSNLDFNITSTTVLKTGLAGAMEITKSNYGGVDNIEDWGLSQKWAGAYNIAPDVFMPHYSDGSWGYYPGVANVSNSPLEIALGGITKRITTKITSDFVLEQDLKFLTEGLSFRGSVSWDNTFVANGFGVNDLYHDPQRTYVNPYTGEVAHKEDYEKYNQFDYSAGVKWSTDAGSIDNGKTNRHLNYQLRLFYGRQFGNHNVTAMGSLSRDENNTGSAIPQHRQDWVFRTTYDYASKYFIEYNGAYNGSEMFGPGYRMGFFNSGALGWAISEEGFMLNLKEKKIIDFLKLRASYGEIGDDGSNNWKNPAFTRFAYQDQWAVGGSTIMNETNRDGSRYTWYRQSVVGNPDLHWEVVRKLNIGVDYAILDGLVAGSVDFFRDKRSDVQVLGDGRSTPAYYGVKPVAANLGEIENKGYEIEVRLDKTFGNGIRAWANLNYTHAENEVIKMDDGKLYASYRKSSGYSIGQTKVTIDNGFMNSYDDVLAAPKYDINNNEKLVGDHYIVDFNGDGKISSDDTQIPYGYSNIPQNTYNASLGVEWKGWSLFAQFYGVNNVTREIALTSFGNQLNNVYDTGTWWSENHGGAEMVTPRWGSKQQYGEGKQFWYDGSYFRLKNAELAYTWAKLKVGDYTVKNLKLFVSGNNLWVWTKMPDDRESNFAGASNQGQYPTVKRVNFGVKFSL